MMNLRQLRHVIEICKAGSFVRAADMLGITQPALSRSIARLERDLGVLLFERHGHGTTPTAFARHILARADNTLNGVTTLVEDVKLLAEGKAGQISIGVGAAARAILAAPLVAKLVQTFPHLRTEIVNGRAPDLLNRLLAREIDIVITTPQVVPHTPEIVRTRLFTDEACYFCRAGHPLLKRRRTPTLYDILAYPLAAPGLPRAIVDQASKFDDQRRRNLTAYVSHDYQIIREIVENSDAVGQAPLSVYPESFLNGDLVRLPSNADDRYYCVAITLRVSMHSPVIGRTVDLAREAAREMRMVSAA